MNYRIVALLAISVSIATLTSCSGNKTTSTQPSADKKVVNSNPTPAPGAQGQPVAGADATKPADGAKPADVTKPGQTVSTSADANQAPGKSPDTSAPAGAAQNQVNLEQLPNNMIICSVGGSPVTVGDYRRMFKMQQLQLNSMATADPMSRQRFLDEAKKRGLTLTADESRRLLETARRSKGSDADFKKFLADKKITEAEFDKEIESMGLAMKTSNVILQENLLSDLINRQILVDAAKNAGFGSKAMNMYIEIKHSPTYAELSKATGFGADDLREELMNTEMTKLMVQRIQQEHGQVTDADMAQYYDKNKAQFKHKERVRLSQIIIGAPAQDSGSVQSVKTQVQRSNPKLSGKELDMAVVNAINNQKLRAESLLVKAKLGGNFAQLSNENNDDKQARTEKTGGDIGWHERGQLIPQFADAVWPLKSGQVYPSLVQTGLGFHIVKVTGHESAGVIPLAEIKPGLKNALQQQKSQQALVQWLQDKRNRIKISLSPKFQSLLGNAGGVPQTTSLNNTTH